MKVKVFVIFLFQADLEQYKKALTDAGCNLTIYQTVEVSFVLFLSSCHLRKYSGSQVPRKLKMLPRKFNSALVFFVVVQWHKYVFPPHFFHNFI